MTFSVLIRKTHFVFFTNIGLVISHLRSCSEREVIIEEVLEFCHGLIKRIAEFFVIIVDIERFLGIVILGKIDFADRMQSELIIWDMVELICIFSIFIFTSNSNIEGRDI